MHWWGFFLISGFSILDKFVFGFWVSGFWRLASGVTGFCCYLQVVFVEAMTIEASGNKKRKITDFFQVSKSKKVKVEAYNGESKEKHEKVEKDEVVKVRKSTFDKEKFIDSLTKEEKDLLQLEIDTMEDSWFELLHKEFRKEYFLNLKRFLKKEWSISGNVIFPPKEDIYSWTRLTPLDRVKVFIIGQDPYHNYNQAHGLAFSVKDRNTRIPPSLVNIFKAIKNDYPEFVAPKCGDLTAWAREGVLMLNTVLTVRAHRANSHAKQGWEQFTAAVGRELVRAVAAAGRALVVLAWGRPAQQLAQRLGLRPGAPGDGGRVLCLAGAHPSPLSAHRGFFTCGHFRRCNEWLGAHGERPVRWQL